MTGLPRRLIPNARRPAPFELRSLGAAGTLIVLWVLSMIALPIARWAGGDAVIPPASTMSAILQAAAVIALLGRAWGWRRVGGAAALVAVLTWGAEWLGSTTGFPFGAYHYSGLLQPQFFGVPLLIPLAWLMMLGPSWAVAQTIAGGAADGGLRKRLSFAALAGLAMVAWDLYLDPQMVGWGFWVWEETGAYFGIPLINFFGWFGVAALVTLVVNPRRVPAPPLLFIYAIVWIFQFIALAAFWGQPGPAVFGFGGMGLMLAAAAAKAGQGKWTR